MRCIASVLVVVLAALGAALATESPTEFVYEVVAVKRHLLLATAEGEEALEVGDHARSGDSLRTGSRSTADLDVPDLAARFHIDAKTRFQLALNRPGILIDVERGSLRAVFGKLSEGDDRERLVTTPSAVLAVRGTDYGVEVEKDGDTTVTVFEGTVDVMDTREDSEIVRVQAGHATRIRRGQPPTAPTAHGLSSEDWDRGQRQGKSNRSSGQQSPAMGTGTQQGSGGSRSQSSQGGSKRHGG